MEPKTETATASAIYKLARSIRASYPLVAIISHEEGRVMSALQAVSGKLQRQVYAWTITTGLQPVFNSSLRSLDNTNDPAAALAAVSDYPGDNAPTIFVFKDLHRFMDDAMIARYLRDIAGKFEVCPHTLLLLSPSLDVPGDLDKAISIIDWPLPGQSELDAVLQQAINDTGNTLPCLLNGSRQAVIQAMQGLTEFEARQSLASAIIAVRQISAAVIPHIVAEKKQIVRKSGLLEFYETDVDMDRVGGLPHLKSYTEVKRATFTKEASDYGVEPARGVLLLGLPGGGKSLMAKAIAGGKMPLLRMDVGALMGSLVGQSEANTRAAFKVAEAIAPCVVWLDEIEKALGGDGGEHDGGTTARVVGSILTFMQETTAPIYWVATANDVRALRPELINRFDDTFFVDLPNRDDRAEILKVHLRLRKRNPEDFDLPAVADACYGFVGREIERLVRAALENAFYQKTQLNTQHLLDAAASIVPISTTMNERIADLRAWADTRARRANDPIEPKPVRQVAHARFAELGIE